MEHCKSKICKRTDRKLRLIDCYEDRGKIEYAVSTVEPHKGAEGYLADFSFYGIERALGRRGKIEYAASAVELHKGAEGYLLADFSVYGIEGRIIYQLGDNDNVGLCIVLQILSRRASKNGISYCWDIRENDHRNYRDIAAITGNRKMSTSGRPGLEARYLPAEYRAKSVHENWKLSTAKNLNATTMMMFVLQYIFSRIELLLWAICDNFISNGCKVQNIGRFNT